MPTLIWSKVKDGLDPAVKKKAYAFLEKLQESDELPGLHIEPIVGSVDPRVRTGRVDEKFRCVMFKLVAGDTPFYVIHGVWSHVKANTIAQQVRLSMNPINGVPEVERVLEEIQTTARTPIPAKPTPAPVESPAAATPESVAVPEAAAPDAVTSAGPATAEPVPVVIASPPRWPAGLTADALHRELGIDPQLAEAALAAATEDALVDDVISRARVEWQADALLELATGSSVADVKASFRLDEPVAIDDSDDDTQLVESINKHPAAQSSFHWLGTDNAELRRVIEAGDLGAWRLFLHPEQRRYAEGTRKGAFRLSGGAGTGKTVVALHRARFLAAQNPQSRILLTTFTRNLADDLATNLRKLDETTPLAARLGEQGVFVRGVDQVTWAVVQRAGDDIADAVAEVLGVPRTDVLKLTPDKLWDEAIEDAGAALPRELATRTFLEAEYTQVVLPNRITDPREYVRVRRAGRGVALDRAKRVAVWNVIDAYRAKARAAGTTDFVEKAAIAARWLEAQNERPFDHVVVDEAQDLTASHLLFLRALVAEGVDDLFICEDSHQRIYGQKVTLSHCGINVRGRARRLTLNYRTTQQNLSWAMGILSGADWTDLEGETEAHTYHSARTGPVPILIPAATVTDEFDAAARLLREWIPGPDSDPAQNQAAGRAPEAHSIAVLVRDKYRRETLVAALAERGVTVRSVDRETPRPGFPLAMTMHRAKGLEFTHVLLLGVQEGAVPKSLREYDTSEADKADALLRERALVYVAATRARDVLAVTWSGERSRLLPAPSVSTLPAS